VELVTPEEAQALVAQSQCPVIVDTFPRGIMGELREVLPGLKQPRVLIHRDLNPKYVEWAKLRDFVQENFDLVFSPGEDGPLADLPGSQKTARWVVRAPQPAGSTPVVVCASGNADELGWFGEAAAAIAPHMPVRVIAPELPAGCPEGLWVRYWPAIDWIAGARVVIGGAGYNTVSECAACGVPLVARAWPRKYDRQNLRANLTGAVLVKTPGEAAVRALELAGAQPEQIPFRNGASEAAERIVVLGLTSRFVNCPNENRPEPVFT
jgi:hypothetical protein